MLGIVGFKGLKTHSHCLQQNERLVGPHCPPALGLRACPHSGAGQNLSADLKFLRGGICLAQYGRGPPCFTLYHRLLPEAPRAGREINQSPTGTRCPYTHLLDEETGRKRCGNLPKAPCELRWKTKGLVCPGSLFL